MDRRNFVRNLFSTGLRDYSVYEGSVKLAADSISSSYNKRTSGSQLEGTQNYHVERVGRREFIIVGGVAVAVIVGGVAYYFNPWFRNLINGLFKIGENGTTTTTGNSTTTPYADKIPPLVKGIKWEPTRVVNSKIYDGKVSFAAEDADSLIAEAYLEFNPVYPEQIPREAIPAEDPRIFSLKPINGVFDSKTANFSQEVTGLIGGKSYQVKVKVKDAAGNKSKSKDEAGNEINILDVPYVREFENIAKEADILVGATYHPWFENPCHNYCHWSELSKNVEPLLGLYNSNDPLVISKHIDWATGFGINHFYCSYNAAADTLADERLKALLSHSLIKDMKFAILYETSMRFGGPPYETIGLAGVNLNDSATFSIIQSDFERIAKNYFHHPSYLTINGQPVIYIYATGVIESDIVTPFVKLRQYLRGLGFEPYFIGDEMEIRWGKRIDSKRLQTFDAVTGYGLPPSGNVNRSASAVRAEYSRWRSAAHAVGVEIIPSVYPGIDDRYLVQIGQRPMSFGYVPRSTEFFKSNLEIASEFIDKSRMLKILSWDEWGENSNIEPSVEDGFKYLQTLRNTLVGH